MQSILLIVAFLTAVRKPGFFSSRNWDCCFLVEEEKQILWWEENSLHVYPFGMPSGHIDFWNILFHLILLSWLWRYIHVTDIGQQILCFTDLLICHHEYEQSKYYYPLLLNKPISGTTGGPAVSVCAPLCTEELKFDTVQLCFLWSRRLLFSLFSPHHCYSWSLVLQKVHFSKLLTLS